MIHIVLYRPEKPMNTGNIIRTCVATNCFLHIIGPLSFSLEEKDLKRAGMDYIENLKYKYYSSVEEFNKDNPGAEIFYISRYGKKVYSEENFESIKKDIYLMFGRESTGIPHDILRAHFDRVLRLPMVSSARSLNLSNCVAIVTYEVLRQLSYLDLATTEMIKGEDFLFEELDKSN